ncbi:MAG: tRNA (adenine(22)-N(1))-methyltransferase TrmK [Bacteriovoracaceae bacterium]
MLVSPRLQYLSSFYHDAIEIWDIGCDHGQLGLSFKDYPQVKAIYLVDASKSVIELLKGKVDAYIANATIFVLYSKGQDLKLESKNKKCIFIAGMGGKEIQEILKNLESQLTVEDRIVISPHRKILELRSYLSESQYRCFTESVIKDGPHFYQIIVLTLDQTKDKVSSYGESLWQTEVGKEYLIHQRAYFSKHQDKASALYVSYLNQLN